MITGFWSDEHALSYVTTTGATTFEPTMSADEREARHAEWQRAVERARDWER